MLTRFSRRQRLQHGEIAYYEIWRDSTRDRVDQRLLDLMPPLAALIPPPGLFDKPV